MVDTGQTDGSCDSRERGCLWGSEHSQPPLRGASASKPDGSEHLDSPEFHEVKLSVPSFSAPCPAPATVPGGIAGAQEIVADGADESIEKRREARLLVGRADRRRRSTCDGSGV